MGMKTRLLFASRLLKPKPPRSGGRRYLVQPTTPIALSAAPGPQIVFHGINKSGSLAMSNVLAEAFEAAGRSSEFLCHYHIGGSYPAFARMATDPYRFVVGHDLYGALPARPHRIWVTQFRHPLPRTLSVYNWLKNRASLEGGEDEVFPSLAEFVQKTGGIGHSQISQFGLGFGKYRDSRRRMKLTPKDLFEISVDTLDANIQAIGIAEHFEESAFVFAHLCGLDSLVPWVRDKRNPGRPLSTEISLADRQLIEDVCEYDFRLYEWALDRFREQSRNYNFSSELAAYQEVCAEQYNDRIV